MRCRRVSIAGTDDGAIPHVVDMAVRDAGNGRGRMQL